MKLFVCVAMQVAILCYSIPAFSQTQLTFNGAPTVVGTAGAVNTTYTYANIGTFGAITVNGIIKIMSITGSATLQNIDATTGGTTQAWQPIINGPVTASGSCWSMQFSINFVDAATGLPLNLTSFRVSAIDIDGDGSTLREFDEFRAPTTYTVENPTALTITSNAGVYNFSSPQTSYAGIALTQTNVIATCNYSNRTGIVVRLGACCVGGTCTATGTTRQYSIDFFNAVAYTSANTTLPVNFISIHGEPMATGNRISWEVADELNIKEYDVERSEDGATFTNIGSVPYVQSGSTNTYSFTDPTSGSFFYRVKSVDIDGRYRYSRIIKISADEAGNRLTLLSNPVRDAVEFQFISSSAQPLKMQIVDYAGRIIQTGTLNAAKGTNIFRAGDLKKFSTGGYILLLTDQKANRYQAKFFAE